MRFLHRKKIIRCATNYCVDFLKVLRFSFPVPVVGPNPKSGPVPRSLCLLAYNAPINRPLPSSKNAHFQNEARCTIFLVKMSFICTRMISISKDEHLLSFWNRGPGKLGHGLFESSTSPPGKPRALTITSFASKDWRPFLTISSWGGEFEFSFLVRSAADNVVWQMRPSSWRNRKKYIEHEFLGRVSGKFPGPTGNIWKGSPVFPHGMFQTEMRVPLMKSHLWYQFQAFAAVYRWRDLICANSKYDSGIKFTSPGYFGGYCKTFLGAVFMTL